MYFLVETTSILLHDVKETHVLEWLKLSHDIQFQHVAYQGCIFSQESL